MSCGPSFPLPFGAVTGGILYYDGGDINVRLANGASQTRTAQQDMAALMGVSLPLAYGLSAGATAKIFRLELAQEVRTTGYAGDVGAIWRTPLRGLNLGVSLQNLGPAVKFEQEADPLPMTVRLGAAYEFNLGDLDWFKEGGFGFSKFLVTGDAVKLRDEGLVPSTGMEMVMALGEQNSAALRFGYIFSQQSTSLTLGVGVRQGRWLLDYGLGAMKTLANTHHFSLGVKF